jgi:hypothetical protein
LGAIEPTIPAPLNIVQPEKVDSYELGEKLSFHGPIAALSYLQATNLLNLNVNWSNIMGKPVYVNFFATNVTIKPECD